MAFDATQLHALARGPVADHREQLPAQAVVSSRERHWPGLLVWRQHGQRGELYVPPIFHHTLVIKLDRPNRSLQARASHLVPTEAARSARQHWGRGDTAIVPAGEASYWSNEAGSDNLHINLEPELLLRQAAQRLSSNAAVLALQSRFVVADERLRLLGLTLLDVLEHPDAGERLFVEHLGATLAAHLLTHYTRYVERNASLATLSAEQLHTVTTYIEAHLAERLTLARLAETVGMSPWHFARCFKHATAQTPHRHLTERRLQKALALLMDTQRSVIHIGLEVGFGDPAHFSHSFKRRYGVSPAHYRRGH